MKNKNWVWPILGIVVLLSCIGGGIYLTREKKKTTDIISVEMQCAKALKNTFANVKSLKFIENKGKNNNTGSYMFIVSMENQQQQTTKFNIIYVKGETKLENYGVKDEIVQKEGVTTTTITVSYSNGKSESL
ncbi:hypothetical protein ACFFIF_10765 [Vagococcus entomophilus]|uniref:Uncharacterized protein n=1 Tax=Vagococcus entomophilus TaxID=1160095 RepID=A0A430AEY1_9ENTE|nr:hypothetical protein [Vagococcus entomophilus]RSU06172.1 hypothetical protein CBF30_10670 [Vagococcus entomophilus]